MSLYAKGVGVWGWGEERYAVERTGKPRQKYRQQAKCLKPPSDLLQAQQSELSDGSSWLLPSQFVSNTNRTFMSCQLQRVTSGQSNSVISRCTFQNSSHIIYLPTYLSIHPSIYLSIISLSLFLSIYTPSQSSTYLPTYLSKPFLKSNPQNQSLHKHKTNKKTYTNIKHEYLKSLSLITFLHTFHSVADSRARAKMDTNCVHRCQTQEYL